ncbi:MAG: J domain-containing protein [Schwartzia sp.]|nr:J domain-containing protein [Schwartzia sp. (in: firmicutes)]
MKDYYEILEVHPKASPEIIKKAYQTLAKRYHPDTARGDKELAAAHMADLNEAYRVLSDEAQRRRYDLMVSVAGDYPGTPAYDQSKSAATDGAEESPAGKRITELCAETVEALEREIRPGKEHETANREAGERLLTRFERDLTRPLSVFENQPGNKESVHTSLGLAYWRLASALTWGGDFGAAERCAETASRYITPDAPFYRNFQRTYTAIRERKTIRRQQKRGNGWLIFACVLLTVVFGTAAFAALFPGKLPLPRLPAALSSLSFLPAPSGPTARRDVRTGYDPSHPLLANEGYCELTVDNTHSDMPVYARLWDTTNGIPVRAFTIRQGESFTLKDLTPGRYEVRYHALYETGTPAFGAKSGTLRLEQIVKGNEIHYTRAALTLNPEKPGAPSPARIPQGQV